MDTTLILEKLINIEKRLSDMENKLNNIENNTDTMDKHITFVEHIFSIMKNPFLKIFRIDLSTPVNRISN